MNRDQILDWHLVSWFFLAFEDWNCIIIFVRRNPFQRICGVGSAAVGAVGGRHRGSTRAAVAGPQPAAATARASRHRAVPERARSASHTSAASLHLHAAAYQHLYTSRGAPGGWVPHGADRHTSSAGRVCRYTDQLRRLPAGAAAAARTAANRVPDRIQRGVPRTWSGTAGDRTSGGQTARGRTAGGRIAGGRTAGSQTASS